MEYGKLLLVATPIGNLKDITLRALEVLGEADVIAAEDTRHTVKLLNHYDIKNKLISFHEFSKESRIEEILSLLYEGKDIALVSDAGTPVISDPGYELVRRCAKEGFEVQSIPGACAAVTAITLSGMNSTHFAFWGFLDQKQSARKKELGQIMALQMPCVVYESPNRILKMLEDVCEVCGEDTPVCVCRELTKLYEETLRTTAAEAKKEFEKREAIKGEFAIVLYPSRQEKEVGEEDIRQALEQRIKSGMTKKSAAGEVALIYGIAKNKAYQLAIAIGDKVEQTSQD